MQNVWSKIKKWLLAIGGAFVAAFLYAIGTRRNNVHAERDGISDTISKLTDSKERVEQLQDLEDRERQTIAGLEESKQREGQAVDRAEDAIESGISLLDAIAERAKESRD